MIRHHEEPGEKSDRAKASSAPAALGPDRADALDGARATDMKKHANIVPLKYARRVRPQRIRDLHDGYRAATDALIVATDLGCCDKILEALWNICAREAGRGANAAASQ